jgi:STAS domain
MSFERPPGPLLDSVTREHLTLVASKPSSIVFAVGGRVARSDIPQLCVELRARLEVGGVALVICDVGALLDPDAAAVDALAQLRLTARRFGCRTRLRAASPELLGLISFMGLAR